LFRFFSPTFENFKIISFSSFIFPRIIPAITQSKIPLSAYKKAIVQPKVPPIKINTTSFTSGEVIKNEKAIPSGISASRKPINTGIQEQEQKGVIAQKILAKIFQIQYFCFEAISFIV
jgi:hypothetical protein